MYSISNAQINCSKDSGHEIPNFFVDSGVLKIQRVTLFKEFHVICESKDISSYTLKSSSLLEPSPIMDYIREIETKYGRPLMNFAPGRYLDILKETESLYALDFRYGMAIGLRRLLEDFIIENYGVLVFFPMLFGKTNFPLKSKSKLKDMRSSWILDAMIANGKFKRNIYKTKVSRAISNNTKLRAALLSEADFQRLFHLYGEVSDYIHGKSAQPSSMKFKDWLELVLKCCLDYCNKNIGWGMP